MPQEITFDLLLPLKLYQIEELGRVKERLNQTGGCVYTWKTTGRSNWFERGLSIVDSLGVVILPEGIPAVIELPDDPADC